MAKKDIESLRKKEFIDIGNKFPDEDDYEKDKLELERLFNEIEESELPQRDKDIVRRDLADKYVKYFKARENILLSVFKFSYLNPLKSTILCCAKNFATKETIDARDLSIEEKLERDLTHAIKMLNNLKIDLRIDYNDIPTSEYDKIVKELCLTYEIFLNKALENSKRRQITYIKEICQNL